jgi:hypothetical protein
MNYVSYSNQSLIQVPFLNLAQLTVDLSLHGQLAVLRKKSLEAARDLEPAIQLVTPALHSQGLSTSSGRQCLKILSFNLHPWSTNSGLTDILAILSPRRTGQYNMEASALIPLLWPQKSQAQWPVYT